MEANREREQTQGKEPRSSNDSSHADPIVQGITKAFQGIQVLKQQQAVFNSQAGSFRVNHSGFRPPIVDGCFKQGEDIRQVERGMREMVLTSRQQQYDRHQHRRQLQAMPSPLQTPPSPPQRNTTEEVKKDQAEDSLSALLPTWSPEPDWWPSRVSSPSPQQVNEEGDQRAAAEKKIMVVVLEDGGHGVVKDKQR